RDAPDLECPDERRSRSKGGSAGERRQTGRGHSRRQNCATNESEERADQLQAGRLLCKIRRVFELSSVPESSSGEAEKAEDGHCRGARIRKNERHAGVQTPDRAMRTNVVGMNTIQAVLKRVRLSHGCEERQVEKRIVSPSFRRRGGRAESDCDVTE